MNFDVDGLSLDRLRATEQAEVRLRRIFIGSLAVCVLVLTHLAFLPSPKGMLQAIVSVSFPPLLLWSLTLAAYAFFTLWVIAKEIQESAGRGDEFDTFEPGFTAFESEGPPAAVEVEICCVVLVGK